MPNVKMQSTPLLLLALRSDASPPITREIPHIDPLSACVRQLSVLHDAKL
jgi:hypothetical protein